MLKDASLTLPRGYNIENGRGGRKVKIWDWKTHAFNKRGLFRGVSQLLLSMIVGMFFEFCTQSLHSQFVLLFGSIHFLEGGVGQRNSGEGH